MARKIATSGGGTWGLDRDEVMTLPRRRAATVVQVHRGTVLVTQEGDRDDHILEAGDELVVRRRGRAVAWAFTEATISLHAASAPAPRVELPVEQGGDAAELWLVAALAHELRNALAGLKAHVQLGLCNPAEQTSHDRLAILERELTRMNGILTRALSSGRSREESEEGTPATPPPRGSGTRAA
jgi:nitrogen-specific signal transduction histidine kinase